MERLRYNFEQKTASKSKSTEPAQRRNVGNEDLLLQVEDMLEELIHTASKSQSSTVSHLAFVLTTLFPKLERVSKLADSATFADKSV